MDQIERLEVRVGRRFDAAPEQVFDAWLDPTTAAKFLFATPTGKMFMADIDARVGGRFTFVDHRPEGDIEHVGKYLEIDRPARLAFTFAVPEYSTDDTKVTIDIAPAGAGCELTLVHERVLPDYGDRTQEGWEGILENLAKAIGA